MIDTHTHLYPSESFPGEEAPQAIRRAIDAGIDTMILPNVDADSVEPTFCMQRMFPDNVKIALGIHPTEIPENWAALLDELERRISEPGVTAMGEIGIDLHWDDTKLDLQQQVFRRQLRMAAAHSLPVLIHQRAALKPTLDILRQADLKSIPAIVFHCFTEGPESVRAIREVVPDALFGIGGVCTFKNAGALKEAVQEIGIDHIVLETDAPYLAPVPHRGKRNESAYIPLIAAKTAEILGISVDEVASITTTNAQPLIKKS